MEGTQRFAVFIFVSLLVFVAVLAIAIRGRLRRPWATIVGLGAVVVVGGMLFARWGQNAGLPWWVYYTLPAALTLVAPPLALRMTAREVVGYLGMAAAMAPAIHLFFSFFFGWHDYMPFVEVPSMADLLRRGR